MNQDLRQKPVRLEVSRGNVWKTVIRFDGADERDSEVVQAAALALALVGGNHWRICTDEHMPSPLMCLLSFNTGWQIAGGAL